MRGPLLPVDHVQWVHRMRTVNVFPSTPSVRLSVRQCLKTPGGCRLPATHPIPLAPCPHQCTMYPH